MCDFHGKLFDFFDFFDLTLLYFQSQKQHKKHAEPGLVLYGQYIWSRDWSYEHRCCLLPQLLRLRKTSWESMEMFAVQTGLLLFQKMSTPELEKPQTPLYTIRQRNIPPP